ncbi:hypothetical protein PO878_12345 [Iamia majanohamensis]|uniref:Replication initiation factor n=1 Tax=Iamia majanohamensis TaxID=467976 RepID=A0AAF0BTV9_9ACTN|nr:hypothetical protein [Iamia majanohamensis]WCO65288.1 hypothetical protein PO878_12345 [Iamia majanohamensis]
MPGPKLDTSTPLLATSPLVELASGVDALYLSGRPHRPPAALLDRLKGAKVEALALSDQVPVEFGGETFRMQPGAFGSYRFRLDHEIGFVGVTPSDAIPTLRFEPRAELLHSLGPGDAVEVFRSLAEDECGPVELSVSRVDVFAEGQGWSLSPDMSAGFVCRAKKKATYEDGDLCTGFTMGRGSKTISARLYDKTAEVAGNGHDWWHDVWGPAFDRAAPVHRVEFQIRREGVRSFQVSEPSDVLDAVGDLWKYCTDEWLTHRIPTGDQTKSRWPVTDEWQAIQRASLRGKLLGVARLKAGARSGALRVLAPLLSGCVSSVGAHFDFDDIDSAVAALPDLLREYEQVSGRMFSERVHEKRARWRHDR